MKKVLLVKIPPPPGNKWTKIWPAMGQIGLQLSFGGLVPAALSASTAAAGGSASDKSLPGEAEAGSAPDTDAFRRLASAQASRASAFATSTDSSFRCLLWLTVGRPIKTVHWKLIRFATWHSHSKDPKERSSAFEFADPQRNPARLAQVDIARLLELECPGWMAAKAVSPASWSRSHLAQAQSVLVLALCNLQNRLVREFSRYPWVLCGACDGERVSER